MGHWTTHLTPELRERIQDAARVWAQDIPDRSAAMDWAAAANEGIEYLTKAGDRGGNVGSLNAALEGCRECLNLVEGTEPADDQQRVLVCLFNGGIGNALVILGLTLGQATYLRDAVVAQKTALRACDRTTTPLSWAWTLRNLGVAFSCLGELCYRESDLREAVRALQAALKVFDAADTQKMSAATRLSLGNALSALGEVLGQEAYLADAATAYRAAFCVFDETADPWIWADTQRNLGIVLTSLGAIRGREAHLDDAVQALQAALPVFDKVDAGLAWARTKINLGNAFSSLGELRAREADLWAAVEAYGDALNVVNEGTYQRDWANAQMGLSVALNCLGDLLSSQPVLRDAERALQAALQVFDEVETPLDWARVQTNLGHVRSSLGGLSGREADLRAATSAYQSALRVQNPHTTPADWIATMGNLVDELEAFLAPPTKEVSSAQSDILDSLDVFATGTVPLHYLRALEYAMRLWVSFEDLGSGVERIAARKMRLALRQAQDKRGRRLVLEEFEGLGDRLTCAALRGDTASPPDLPALLDLTRAREMSRRIDLAERAMTDEELSPNNS